MEQLTEPQIVKADFLIDLLQSDPFIQYTLDCIRQSKKDILQLKHLAGSFGAIVAGLAYLQAKDSHFFILTDKEEALFFYHDLKELLPPDAPLYFLPNSYKRPYEFVEVENANILQRGELIHTIFHLSPAESILIVSYPEALSEKVLTRKQLNAITLDLKVGEVIDRETLVDLLLEHNFESVDFVYEPGQFAVRGSILDVYSYAYRLPYRIDLSEDTIDSIRTFDPISQTSKTRLERVVIIPDVETKSVSEERISLLQLLPDRVKLWFKDLKLTLSILERSFEAVCETFEQILAKSGQTQVISDPEKLFDTAQEWRAQLKNFTQIEFGRHFYHGQGHSILFDSHVQPNFNKNYDFLLEDLQKLSAQGFKVIIAAKSIQQLDKLRIIFDELNTPLDFSALKTPLSAGFYDQQIGLVVYTDHQIFSRLFVSKAKKHFSKREALSFKAFSKLKIGDYVTHIDYGVAKYTGLHKIFINHNEQEVVRLIFKDNGVLYVNIHALHKISKYRGADGYIPRLASLDSDAWIKKKSRVKRRIKDIAKDLIQLYAKRRAAQGYSFGIDNYMLAKLEADFLYEETQDQNQAIKDVKLDLEKPYPMDRLVCGDVGFGKTEVAIRAAFKVVCHAKQVAVLVPTTILAMQHFKTFSARLQNLPCKVDYVNRFRTAKDLKIIRQKIKLGQIDILIGTHKMVNKLFEFKDLGLIIVDEEQKFGVAVKEKLKQIKVNVDTLTLSATPIPRTLNFSLMGARDLSIINTAPANRLPVKTFVDIHKDTLIRDAIKAELDRSGQVFFIHNRVKDIESLASKIVNLVPDARTVVVHGQMAGDQLEKKMVAFINHEYDLMVCTNIIESGLDISNVNTIIINNAHHFGLSDLHQMRGRVGRSNRQAYCYLLVPNLANISLEARKRLLSLEEFTDLGEGFKIAMRDLEIRGAGNLLGAEQSGFINDMGLETYQQVLTEAVQELKESEFQDLFEADNSDLQFLFGNCVVETDLEVLIPESYITRSDERLNLYTELDAIKDERGLERFKSQLIDRYGQYPESINSIFKILKVRWLAENLGIERVVYKQKILKLFLPRRLHQSNSTNHRFDKIMTIIQTYPDLKIKDTEDNTVLRLGKVGSIEEVFGILSF